MTETVFVEQVQRLKNTWGEDLYPDERIKLFWEKFEAMPDPWFRNACSEFIGNRRHAPMMAEFLADAEDFRKREKENALIQARSNRGGTDEIQVGISKTVKEDIDRFLGRSNVIKMSGRDRAAGEKE